MTVALEPRSRRQWMAVLAQASVDELEGVWRDLPDPPAYRFLRRPTIGLIMVRARAGGTGARFNLGEMTVTRCTVELQGGGIGHAYVGGRSHRHAELAAVFDAMLQHPAWRDTIRSSAIEPLWIAQDQCRAARAAEAARTKVEFFTLVRGED